MMMWEIASGIVLRLSWWVSGRIVASLVNWEMSQMTFSDRT